MIAGALISDSIPSVSPSETGLKALNLMEIFRITHLPVVKDQEYLGIITDQDIYDADNFEERINDYKMSLIHPHVFRNQHIFEVVSVASRWNLSIIPVLDLDRTFLGAISTEEVTRKVASLVAVDEPGGIIVLELCDIDFSLTEIANIIESNDAKVLSLYVHRPSSSSKELDIVIKVNTVEMSSIVQTFTRYDYTIKGTFMDNSIVQNMYDDRYDQFMRYIST